MSDSTRVDFDASGDKKSYSTTEMTESVNKPWLVLECAACSLEITIPGVTDEVHVTPNDQVYHQSCWDDVVIGEYENGR